MIQRNKKGKLRKVFIILLMIGIVGIIIVFSINLYIKKVNKPLILMPDDTTQLNEVDCILILGAGVWNNNRPSHMLEDRLLQGIDLYNKGVAPKIIMSGDHGRKDYDEVNVMKNFAIEKGVPSEDIFMDHAGFSTYDSLYRARDVFEADNIIIISQEYHLYRALYLGNKLGLEVHGVSADLRPYVGQSKRELREILARNKDFLYGIVKPKPTYLGDTIPVSGNGDITND